MHERFGNVRLMYRLVLAVDVEKYSSRDAREQLRAQTELHRILSLAAEKAGLDQREWYEQVSGDGELVVLPKTWMSRWSSATSHLCSN